MLLSLSSSLFSVLRQLAHRRRRHLLLQLERIERNANATSNVIDDDDDDNAATIDVDDDDKDATNVVDARVLDDRVAKKTKFADDVDDDDDDDDVGDENNDVDSNVGVAVDAALKSTREFDTVCKK